MRMRQTTALATVLAVLITGSCLWGDDTTPGRLKAGEESAFAVSRMTAPPKIDGVIDPTEWRSATAVSGALDQGNDLLDARPITFFLGWDAGHLYMACRAYLPARYKPSIATGRSPDGASCFDDGLELLFKPLGGNVDAQHRVTEYKLNINGLGYGGEYTRLVVGQIMKNWEPKMNTAVRFTKPGTAPNGGCWWEMEAVFDNADFELVGDNKAGDKWLMMLGVNHLPVPWMQERIPCIGDYFNPQGKSAVTLVENAPAIQMTMDSLSNLAVDGTASLSVKAFNPAKIAAQVKVDVNVADKIVKSETLDLPSGGEKAFVLNEKLPAGVTSGRMNLTVTDSGKTLLSYTALFKVGSYLERLASAKERNPNEFDFSVRFNPLRGLLHLHADSYYLPDPAAAKALKYSLTRKGSDKPVAEGEITRISEWYFDEVLTLKDLAAGEYAVTVSIMLKDGTTFGPRNDSFEKKDEAKAFPEWWNNQVGEPERVVPPFTAIKRVQGSGGRVQAAQDGALSSPGTRNPEPETLSCWGREYVLNALGLPDSVTSQNGAVLAAPARIVVTVKGKEKVVKLGAPVITDAKDWRVRFSGKAEGGGLAFEAEGWMEQDGMVSVDLTYKPKNGGKVRIDALRIEYPLTDDAAECLVSVGPGGNCAAKSTIVLPAGKKGRLWSTFDIGRKGNGMKVGSFYPGVWVGGDRRGLLWWADSDKGWFPADDIPAHEVIRGKDAMTLRNNIISKPVELDGARRISFTWMASPFKPLPKGWRMITETIDATFFSPFRGVRINPKTGKPYADPRNGNCNWIQPESDNPTDWSRLWAEQKTKGLLHYEAADAHVRRYLPFDIDAARTGIAFNHMSFQLIGYGHKSIEDDVFTYFGDEWYPDGDSWNPSYIDYAMWLLDRAFREGGVVSTYWDLSFPIQFSSPLCGLAYRLPDGRIQPGYNSLNCREFFKRLWAVQDKNDLNPGAVGSHSTHAYIFPSLPWIDSILDGERDWNLDVSDLDWVDYYPTERMRSMSNPHNWGVGICWMAYFASSDERKILKARIVQGEYVFMHDSWLNPELKNAMHMRRMPQPILDWGMNGERVEYHPYWRNPFAASADKDILVSLWRVPDEADGRILVGIFNYDRKNTKDIVVKLDLAKLGFAGKKILEARDLYKNFVEAELATGNHHQELKETLQMSNPELGAAVEFDAVTGTLRIKGLGAHRGRFVGVGATDEAALAEARKHLPEVSAGLLPAVADLGFVRNETQYYPDGKAPNVSCDDPSIKISAWQLPDRTLLVVRNGDATQPKDAVVKLDLDKLGLVPQLRWQEFIGVRDLNKGEKDVEAKLDFYGRSLSVRSMRPDSTRLICIREY